MRRDEGSSPVEFVLVGSLLTIMTVVVLQVGVAIYARNIMVDAAVEGAHQAALADAVPADGANRTYQIVSRALGTAYAQDVSVVRSDRLGVPTIEVTVRAPLPVLGLVGLPDIVEVTGYAPVESLTIE